MVEAERQGYNGRMLTVRGDDRRALALILDVPIDDVRSTLDRLDLIHRQSYSTV